MEEFSHLNLSWILCQEMVLPRGALPELVSEGRDRLGRSAWGVWVVG